MSNLDAPTPKRDYSSISISAKYVLLLKGVTDIPYARETAELISLPGKFEPDYALRDFALWARILHFEARYKSINQLLAGLPAKNILELSSGFSLRGLAATALQEIHYIDTDLPDLIDAKRDIIAEIQKTNSTSPCGNLELLPLNALDEKQFEAVTNRFGPGQVIIVNEGLLMYLGNNEKKLLCQNIRQILKKRGGYWITADVYIRARQEMPPSAAIDKMAAFFEQMHIRENMFESFEEAEAFFRSEGFVVDKEAINQGADLSALKYLLASANDEQKKLLGAWPRIRATWRLKLAD